MNYSHNGKSPAAFLDRDGTINIDKGYIGNPDDIELLPHAAQAISILNKLGLKIIIITNQSGIARGRFTEDDLQKVNERVKNLLYAEGAYIDAVYFCPHHPEKGIVNILCTCRKPGPDMLYTASKDLNIDLPSSYTVGDKISDVQAGHNAGTKSILLALEGNLSSITPPPEYTCNNLMNAALWIKKDMEKKEKPFKK